MATLPKGRRVGRAAVNELTALLERHDHIVQKIDGENDFGEDLYVTFCGDGRTTGDVIKIQVKGGISWRRANGYAVPVAQHADTWSDGNIPVLCVVYDPETAGLYWANATDQLRRARVVGTSPASIGISPNSKLDDTSLDEFVASARRFIERYRGVQAVRTYLGEMAGVDFEPNDQVQHFVNESGEVLIFWQRLGDDQATLLHSDLDWEPHPVTPDSLRFGGLVAQRYGSEEGVPEGLRDLDRTPFVGDVILDIAEALWLAACFSATGWTHEAIPDPGDTESDTPGNAADEHADIDAELLDDYVLEQVLDRLELEPELITRSVEVLRRTDLGRTTVDELCTLESDPELVDEAMALSRTTIDKASFEAVRLVLLYVIDRVVIGSPSLPLDQQIRIEWRVPEPFDPP